MSATRRMSVIVSVGERTKRTLPVPDAHLAVPPGTCVCPAGKVLFRKGRNLVTHGFVSAQFRRVKRNMLNASAPSSRCLATCDTTRGLIASHCTAERKSTGNGSRFRRNNAPMHGLQ